MTRATEQADIRELQVEAERAVQNLPLMNAPASRMDGGWSRGIHGRRRAGPGDSFWQYRGFQSGDSSRDIDWRRSARADSQLFIRQKEWESAQNIYLWCDASPSMHYASDTARWRKIDRAVVLALGAARLLSEGGERIGALGTDDPRCLQGRYGMEQLAAQLAPGLRPPQEDSAAESSLPAPPRTKHAHAILISDFLMDEAALQRHLRAYAAAGIGGQMIQVLDPAEFDFPFQGRTRLEGLEGETALTLPRAQALRQEYQNSLRAWQETLAHTAGQMGWSFTIHNTAHPPQSALMGIMGGHFRHLGAHGSSASIAEPRAC